MSVWTTLHLYTDNQGVSHVDSGFQQELAEIDFAPPATPMLAGHPLEASALVMVELPLGWNGGWHPSPCAQWVICLAGAMGYEASDGTQFTLHPDSCILTTDTHGQGHNSWNAGQEPVKLALVQG